MSTDIQLLIITEYYSFTRETAAILNFGLGAPQDIFQKFYKKIIN